MTLIVGARSSPLSLAQVKEVFSCLKNLPFELKLFDTTGDLDQKTSLRTLDKTNFFTKEIDDALLNGQIRVAIHSAKDLPDPIPKGLTVIALTEGVSPLDALVIKEKTLKKSPLIATSSVRREENVLKVVRDARFTDIRGTIHERLKKLDEGFVDGVVIAEAALIRLGIKRERIFLPGETTPYQGQLAILGREGDVEAHSLFAPIDGRKKVLFGVTKPKSIDVIHCPLIEIHPLEISIEGLNEASHILFTSKTAVSLFSSLKKKITQKVIAIGEATGSLVLSQLGVKPMIAANATQEGVVALLEQMEIKTLFWPRSQEARDVIDLWAEKKGIPLFAPFWYETKIKAEIPTLSWERIEEVFLSSPSTVEAYLHHFGSFDKRIKYDLIGPVTKKAFEMKIHMIGNIV